jgi:hypothetical protein
MPAACGRGYDFKPAWFDAVKAARLKRFPHLRTEDLAKWLDQAGIR